MVGSLAPASGCPCKRAARRPWRLAKTACPEVMTEPWLGARAVAHRRFFVVRQSLIACNGGKMDNGTIFGLELMQFRVR